MKRQLGGVIPILPTPFSADGDVDLDSFCSGIELAIRSGVHAVAMFGLASEYYKLSDDERHTLTRVLIRQVSGRIPTVISIVQHATKLAVDEAMFAESEGAAALMVLPPFFLSPDQASIKRHIEDIAKSVSIPIVIQYAPAQTGFIADAGFFASLQNEVNNVQYVKVDMNPAEEMVKGLHSVGVNSVVGYMGLNLPEDYAHGARGVMPTLSLSPLFVKLWNLLEEGDPRSVPLHKEVLPLLSFMMRSIECLISCEKFLLEKCGVIRSRHCRRPSYLLDRSEETELAALSSGTLQIAMSELGAS